MGQGIPFHANLADDGRRARIADGLIDPVALEDRLRVARARRAEAVALRTANQTVRTPSPPAGPDPVPHPETAPQIRTAHPLVAVLAIGLTASAIFSPTPKASHPSPEPAQIAMVTEPALPPASSPAPAAPPPAERADAATPKPSPVLAPARPSLPVRTAAPRDDIVTLVAAPIEAAPIEAAPPAPTQTAPPVAPRPTAKATRPPASEPAGPALRPETLLVYVPSGEGSAAFDVPRDLLRASGFVAITDRTTDATIRRTNVRFYNPGDAAAASAIADLIGDGAVARDFSASGAVVSPGRIEIWMAGSPSGPAVSPAPAVATLDPTAKPPSRTPVDGPSPDPALAALERQIAAVTDNIETLTDKASRDINRAVEQAIRALEGR